VKEKEPFDTLPQKHTPPSSSSSSPPIFTCKKEETIKEPFNSVMAKIYRWRTADRIAHIKTPPVSEKSRKSAKRRRVGCLLPPPCAKGCAGTLYNLRRAPSDESNSTHAAGIQGNDHNMAEEISLNEFH
jgi:hypothetical protein